MAPERLSEVYSLRDLMALAESGTPVGGHILVRSARASGYTRFVAVVRDPRARLLSLYRYWQSIDRSDLKDQLGARGHWIMEATGSDLEHFLTVGRGHLDVDNGIHNFVTPASGNSLSKVFLKRWARPEVIRVFWNDELEELVRFTALDLNNGTSVDLPPVEEVNVTTSVGPVEHLNPRTLELLGERTERDYDAIRVLMNRGCLSYRSQLENEADLFATADRLGFTY